MNKHINVDPADIPHGSSMATNSAGDIKHPQQTSDKQVLSTVSQTIDSTSRPPPALAMTYDEILEQIGDFGPYQKMSYFLLCTPAIMKAAILMSAVFVLQMPQFRCSIPGLANDTFEVQGDYHRALVNRTVPPATHGEELRQVYSQCYVYSDVSSSQELWDVPRRSMNLSVQLSKCDNWVYDKSEVHSSILTEYNFVCDKKAMKSHTNMGFFCGSLVGSVSIGAIADIFGRKKAILLCLGIQVVCGSSLYFISPMVAVVVVRSLQGMACVMFAISASTGMELVGPTKRMFAGVGVQLFWSSGQLLVVMVAFVCKDWRVSELVYGLCAVPIFAMVCVAPESPRWLIDKQRFEEADRILQRIAKSNKIEVPEDNFKIKADGSTAPKCRIWDLLSNWVLLVTFSIVFFNWFAVNFMYNGLSLNLGNLSGSLYVNFLISLAVETMGFLLCLALLNRTGRKRLHIACIFIGGLTCMSVNFPVLFGNADHQWIITTLAMIGKMMASCCYSILYIMSVEMFPTGVRTSALGVCSVFENGAAMASTYIADLGILVGGSLSKALPTTVFGGVALLAALLSILLPETLHQPMPETFNEVPTFFQSSKSSSKCYNLNQAKVQTHF